jgi:hypothetical protein
MKTSLLTLALLAPLPVLALPGLSIDARAFAGGGSIGGGISPDGFEAGGRATVVVGGNLFGDVQYTRFDADDNAFGDGRKVDIDEMRVGGGYQLSLPVLPIASLGVYAHYINRDVDFGAGGIGGRGEGHDVGVVGRLTPLPLFGLYARVGRIDVGGPSGYGAEGLDALGGVDFSLLPFVGLFFEVRHTQLKANGQHFDSTAVRGGLRVSI